MTEVNKLKEVGIFIVEEWMEVYRFNGIVDKNTGYKIKDYEFKYKDGDLIIVEDGKEKQLLEADKTLYDLAKEERILFVNIQPVDGVSFNLCNPRIRFFE